MRLLRLRLLRLLRLLRPGGSHHRGGASIGAPASRLPVALASTDPGTNGPLSYIFKNFGGGVRLHGPSGARRTPRLRLTPPRRRADGQRACASCPPYRRLVSVAACPQPAHPRSALPFRRSRRSSAHPCSALSRLLRLLRPGGSHHRGGASIGEPASRVPSRYPRRIQALTVR